MRLSLTLPISATLVFSALTAASPVAKRDSSVTDVQILQFALTLEHLESAFYSQALSKFNSSAFVSAALPNPNDTYARFEQIAEHEATHVQFLTETLEGMGEAPTQACNYSFPYTDPASFAKLSEIFEGVGTSAYLGAASLLQNKTLVTYAGAILTTEARQNAWVASYVNGGYPWSGPFDTPLTASQAFSLASPFIVANSCPTSNPSLPVTSFPTLTVNTPAADVIAGGEISVSFAAGSNATQQETDAEAGAFFLALKHGFDTFFVPLTLSNATALPQTYTGTLPTDETLTGTVYAFVTSCNDTSFDDELTVTGAALLVFAFPASANETSYL